MMFSVVVGDWGGPFLLEETKRVFLDFEMPNIDVNESTISKFLTYAQHASHFSLSFFFTVPNLVRKESNTIL